MKLFMILPLLLAAAVASHAPPPPCGWEGVGVTPDWQFTGAAHHQWSSSPGAIRFDFDDDPHCGGTNAAVQEGLATWTMNLPQAAEITLSMDGMAEANFEKMTLTSDGVVVATVIAENSPGTCRQGTCDMCPVNLPPTTLSLAAGPHTLQVDVTTVDHQYTNDSFFEIDFSVEGVPDCPHFPPPPPPPPPPSPSLPLCSSGSEAPCNCVANAVTGDTSTCKLIGEPHILSFGGTQYTNFHHQGLYELAHFTIAPCGCEVVVQAFIDTYNDNWSFDNTATAAIAVRVGDTTFAFYSSGESHLADVSWSSEFSAGGWSTSLDNMLTPKQFCGGRCILERSGLEGGETCNPAFNNDGCWGIYTTGWRLRLPGGAGNLLVVPWKGKYPVPNGAYWYDTWLHVAKSVIDVPGCTTGLCHDSSCLKPADITPAELFSCDVSQPNSGPQCHPVLNADAVFSGYRLNKLQQERNVNPSTRVCGRRLQSNELLPSQPPAAASNESYISACTAAGIDPATVLASCDAGCGPGMAENCAYDYCATGDSAFINRYKDICAIDKTEMLVSPPPPAPPPSPLPPCEMLQECKDECMKDQVVCKSGCANKKKQKKCKKKCKKGKNNCKNSCESQYKCDTSCEDNTIPGFGSWWCELNAPHPSFCRNEAQKNKCKKTCGLCR